MKLIRLDTQNAKLRDALKVAVVDARDEYDARDRILHMLEQDFALSPADLQALNLRAWLVLERLKEEIQSG